jgi:phospholipid-binding lipoprotein MlaA
MNAAIEALAACRLGRVLRCVLLPVMLVLSAGCATAPQQPAAAQDAGAKTAQPADPWEPFNRAMFRFNQDLDEGLLYPLSSAYVALVPELVRLGVTNFFNNAADLWSAVNLLLQGRLEQSVQMSFRFAWNTVYGVAGILDLATELGIERTPEDFGQTLAVWGAPPGNFLMLPFFGPSTVRDTIALPLDIAATPAYAIGEGSFRPVTTVIQILDTRSQLIGATQLLDTLAVDKYSFVRDAYLARRQRLIEDVDRQPDEADSSPPRK